MYLILNADDESNNIFKIGNTGATSLVAEQWTAIAIYRPKLWSIRLVIWS